MNRIYRILTLKNFNGDWGAVPAASIDLNPWGTGGPLPPAEVSIAFDGSRFHVRMKAWEKNLRVVSHAHNGSVWEDSCVEFFMNAAPHRDKRYLNFEVNAEGTMLLQFGEARGSRSFLDFDPVEFGITADIPTHGAAKWNLPFYTMRFTIPVSFLEGLYGKLDIAPGYKMAGNFQKCGEKTANPHYGVWNPILTPAPDFHRPEYFGDLIIS